MKREKYERRHRERIFTVILLGVTVILFLGMLLLDIKVYYYFNRFRSDAAVLLVGIDMFLSFFNAIPITLFAALLFYPRTVGGVPLVLFILGLLLLTVSTYFLGHSLLQDFNVSSSRYIAVGSIVAMVAGGIIAAKLEAQIEKLREE